MNLILSCRDVKRVYDKTTKKVKASLNTVKLPIIWMSSQNKLNMNIDGLVCTVVCLEVLQKLKSNQGLCVGVLTQNSPVIVLHRLASDISR